MAAGHICEGFRYALGGLLERLWVELQNVAANNPASAVAGGGGDVVVQDAAAKAIAELTQRGDDSSDASILTTDDVKKWWKAARLDPALLSLWVDPLNKIDTPLPMDLYRHGDFLYRGESKKIFTLYHKDHVFVHDGDGDDCYVKQQPFWNGVAGIESRPGMSLSTELCPSNCIVIHEDHILHPDRVECTSGKKFKDIWKREAKKEIPRQKWFPKVVWKLARGTSIPTQLLLENDKRPTDNHVTLSPAEDQRLPATRADGGGVVINMAAPPPEEAGAGEPLPHLPWEKVPGVLLCLKAAADWPEWFNSDDDESLAAALDYAMDEGMSCELDLANDLGVSLLALAKRGTPPSRNEKLDAIRDALHVLETFLECTDDADSPIWPGWRLANAVCKIENHQEHVIRATNKYFEFAQQRAPK
jgi:hypothetical protein